MDVGPSVNMCAHIHTPPQLSGSGPDVAQYASTLKTQYSLITAENACKWPATEPVQGQFDFTGCDFLKNWAARGDVNQTFRGE